MNPKTLEQLVREIIPMLGTTWVDNYEGKRDWIREAEAALAALKPDEPAPDETLFVYGRDPLICHCGNFVSEGLECENCGGLLF